MNKEKPMNKKDLIDLMVSKAEKPITKTEAERALNLVTEAILEAIEQGKGVSLIGFGSFEVQHRAAREGRNPKTGEKMSIAAYKQPVFKAGSNMKKASNS